jgi:hypothetical protein
VLWRIEVRSEFDVARRIRCAGDIEIGTTKRRSQQKLGKRPRARRIEVSGRLLGRLGKVPRASVHVLIEPAAGEDGHVLVQDLL